MATPRRPPGVIAALLAVAVLGTVPSAAAAASPACAELEGRDLVPAATIRVVDRTSRPSGGVVHHRYLACTRPRGRVRALEASPGSGRLELLDARGAFLAVRDRSSRRVSVVNVLRGTRRRLAAGADPVGPVVLGRAGEAAGVVRRGGSASLVGFDFDGRAYPLDRGAIPRRSLRRGKGERVVWTRGGTMRSADLSAPQVACDRLGGTTTLQTDTLRVVRFTFDDEFLAGEIDGRTTRVRACLRPAGPVRVLGSSAVASDGVQGGLGFEVLAGAGSLVLERERSSDSQGDVTPDAISVHDLATDEQTTLWGNADADGPNAALGTPLAPVVLSASGQAGAVFEGDTGAETVVGFTAGGRAVTLDAGPAAEIDQQALGLAGSVLRWTRGGQQRTADLAGP